MFFVILSETEIAKSAKPRRPRATLLRSHPPTF